ncbi:MAG: flagellar basal body rod protein FlgB [Sneathiella sp.]|uniref:flagellar basal body rod protein FlgB n=1 Tax=Sneathiella sp. TaxID=1964365 RepID=UPI000C5057DB|nr:flagellar basal body rod protein FlgB [Sneathiella sp.]MAZ02227.1 flagellar basal body rod protein FlgB [Sneathiella sp.]|tara:strand:- start:25508 stop:25912 length:405 start_codon:yes stop_codon:yes gene_type:complete
MNLDKIPIFAALTEKMKWLTARQNVLAQNIANSDTPNYRARDLKPLEFREMIEGPKEDDGVQISRTNMRHIFVDEITSYETVINRESSETTPTGNAVLLEQEMMKVAETQIQYELTTSLYKKNLGMLKTALGRR